MLGIKNNRTTIKGKHAEKLKGALNDTVVSPDEDYAEKLTDEIIDKVDEFLNDKGEISDTVIETKYDDSAETLYMDISYKVHKPIDKVDITMPEGMSAKQYEIMCKQILKDAQENNVHDFELTS